MTIKAKKSGYCWTSSGTTVRRDAWRCFVGNLIYDPCFSSSAAKSIVLCPTAPWNNAGIEIKLTKSLPTSQANRGPISLSDQPWALHTDTGRNCVFNSGTGSVIRGVRSNYYCSGAGAPYLWGYPDRHVEPWTIYTAPADATHLTTTVSIRQAWM